MVTRRRLRPIFRGEVFLKGEDMENKTKQLLQDALSMIEQAKSKQELSNINTEFLGKKGKISELLHHLKKVSAEERPKVGAFLNKCRDSIEQALRNKTGQIERDKLNEKLMQEKVDITIPVKPLKVGTLNPITQIQKLLTDFFVRKGFTIKTGTDIETDYYCFEALNVPKNHPARDAQDTFYINDEVVLRTHTSSTQIHTLEKEKPPIKMVSTGSTYRIDEVDGTHSPFFHQLEIMVIDENVSMADLKGILEEMVKCLFGEKTEIRLRPSYFPFTEPSAELDATCIQCGGKGCSLCKGTGWIELIGCGMVNPKILENHGIDSSKYAGYAAGIGLERIAMLRYGITDIRDFFANDINLLEQFK